MPDDVQIVELKEQFSVDDRADGVTVFRAWVIRNLAPGQGSFPEAFPSLYSRDVEYPNCLLVSRRILSKTNPTTVIAGTLYRSNNPFTGGVRRVSAGGGRLATFPIPWVAKYTAGSHEAYELREYTGFKRATATALLTTIVYGKSSVELTEAINKQLGRWYVLVNMSRTGLAPSGPPLGIVIQPQLESETVFYVFSDWSARDSGTGAVRITYRFDTFSPVPGVGPGAFGAAQFAAVPPLLSCGEYSVQYENNPFSPPTIVAMDPRVLYAEGGALPGVK